MKILVTGSRDWSNLRIPTMVLTQFANYDTHRDVELIHGNAKGLDTIAAGLATNWGWKVTSVPADWDKHGRAAGPIRNREMLAMKPDIVLGFLWTPSSKGTMDCLTEAKLRGFEVHAWDREGNVVEI